jgi:ABC-type transport system substrate-binding protein
MNKRKLKLGFALTTSLLVLSMIATAQTSAAVIEPDQSVNVIRYAFPYDFPEFTVWTADSYATAQWASAIYNGLLKRESVSRDWVPELASDLPTAVNTTYFTVPLKEGLMFENGDPLTASDVEFSYKVALTAAINSNTYGGLQPYLGNSSVVADATDPLLVHVYFKTTYAFVQSLLTSPIVSEEAWGARYDDCITGNATACDWNAADGSDNFGTAGPFKFKSFDTTNQVLTVERNDNYYAADTVQADEIEFIYIADKVSAISELAAGNIDILDSQYVPGLTELVGLPVIDKFVGDPANQEISLNHQHPIFGTGTGIPDGTGVTDVDAEQARLVRKAMSHIVARDFFVDEVLEGLAQPAATAMPSASLGWDSSVEPDPFNITRARELMEEAGFVNSNLAYDAVNDVYTTFHFNITVLSPNTNPARNQWSAAWANQLSSIGIGLTEHVSTGWSVITPRTFGWSNATLVDLYEPTFTAFGGYDVLFVGNGWPLDFDPTGIYTDSGLCDTGSCDNFYNFVNATINDAIIDYASELDYDTRTTKVEALQAMLAHELPVIPILYPQSHWGWDETLVGIDALLLSTSSQEWDNVRKSTWEERIATVTDTQTTSLTNTVTDVTTDTDTVVQTDTLDNTVTGTVTETESGGLPIGFAPVAVAMFSIVYVTTYMRRRD